ncbi:MAG: ATP-binding protein [Spirochaetales bacterium]|nr:ATP-binding protein [Spirochaetales bacterium]
MVLRNDYFDTLWHFKDKQIIKVITGLRRSGKSTLMEQFCEKLRDSGISDDQIFYLKMDDVINEPMLDYHILHFAIRAQMKPDKMNYILIDEVQMCKDFQKAINSLFLRKNVDIYLTGSNADLLSGELATLLSGRYITIDILPFSFSEYINAAKDNHFPEQPIEDAYRDYIRFGSMPFTLQLKRDEKEIQQYLSDVYNTIIVKDIVARHQINDFKSLESVIKFVFDNCANIFSAKKIADTLTSGGKKTSSPTVENYLQYLEECFMIYRIDRYDIKGKARLSSLPKYYIADIGLRNSVCGFRNIDTGHILENLIFLELKRRKYEVYTGKNGDNEIDFIAYNQNEKYYIQVSETVKNEETLQRELKSFNNIRDAYPRILITLDYDINADYNGVRSINAYDFLLGKVQL